MRLLQLLVQESAAENQQARGMRIESAAVESSGSLSKIRSPKNRAAHASQTVAAQTTRGRISNRVDRPRSASTSLLALAFPSAEIPVREMFHVKQCSVLRAVSRETAGMVQPAGGGSGSQLINRSDPTGRVWTDALRPSPAGRSQCSTGLRSLAWICPECSLPSAVNSSRTNPRRWLVRDKSTEPFRQLH